tara:strand:+ start:3362 stop:3517 length:156 start_codon:yes stop_codon:yes gene_type:complete
MDFATVVIFIITILLINGCSEKYPNPENFGVAENPRLPAPKHDLFPTIALN